MAAGADRVEAVRAFNRDYTNVIGVLRGGLLETPYSLAEARVIFELAQQDVTEVSDLRRTLDIDPGYLSRILGRLEGQGLVRRERSASDARRQVVTLTSRGRRAFRTLDGRSARQVRDLLAEMRDEDQGRLVSAMRTIRRVLLEPTRSGEVVLREPSHGDYGWVVGRHGLLYAEEYGWDETFEALVAGIVGEHVAERDPLRERAWIAEVDGEPAGCVFCVRRDDRTAQLRLLLVEPWARVMGVGTRLVDECLRFARDAGYTSITLWTNHVLEGARRIYERAGFELVEQERHHSFGHDLVGQNWSREL